MAVLDRRLYGGRLLYQGDDVLHRRRTGRLSRLPHGSARRGSDPRALTDGHSALCRARRRAHAGCVDRRDRLAVPVGLAF